MTSKNPTLRDIAKQADVALSTVSQVLNNQAGVSPELRRRVLETAEKLGYRQKVTINSPVVPRLNTIGLVTRRQHGERLAINPFYSYIMAGIENECQKHNINLMYASINVDDNDRALSLPPMLLDKQVDAVIVVGTLLEETLDAISNRIGQNVVLVDAYTSNHTLFDSILIDNFNGAKQAVNYLIENGHRQIGLIGSHPLAYPSITERRHGYFAALEQHGITHAHTEDSLHVRADAFRATLRLLKTHAGITAIFACNDDAAIGAMNALKQMGRRVPEDVSVIGFDDIDVAQEVTPALTTIRVDKVLMGAMAVQHLRDRAENSERPAIKTLITTQLIIRESVQAVAT